MRHPIFEPVPQWEPNRYVVGVVHTEVGAGEDLLREIRINNDRIHRDIRKVAGLIKPCE